MATAQGRGLRPGGVVRAFGRLVLLIGVGFTAGLAIGVLSEEPELLAGHLRGQGESVALIPAADPRPATEGGSEQRLAAREAEVEADDRDAVMQPRVEEMPSRPLPGIAAARPASPAATSSRLPWTIQVGAFSDEKAALRLTETLRQKGYPAELLAATRDSQRWRVRVQPIERESEAHDIARKLKRVEGLPTWVLPMEGGSRR